MGIYKLNVLLRQNTLSHMRDVMEQYAPISDELWAELLNIVSAEHVQNGANVIKIGDVARNFYFLSKGLFRVYFLGGVEFDKEINKNFFVEGQFPASLVASLKNQDSDFCLQSLEDSIVVKINHSKYRELLFNNNELMQYHIIYLETNWVLKAEPFVSSLLADDSMKRYEDFLRDYPNLVDRIPLHHVASKIGITPTQLSRIRKKIK